MTELKLELGERSYIITVGHGLLAKAGELMKLDRKVFIVTDSGVPREYAEAIANAAGDACIYTIPMGEASKNLNTFSSILSEMLKFGMTRTDCAVAVGGGVVGDITGFAAACFMRGIDFYNVPTTVLSQVDSSIGGKTAVDLDGVKNIVGAFHQPKAVLIDLDVLKTLDKRQISAGLAEAVKMSLTSDAELFSIFENEDIGKDNIETVIVRSLMIKKQVVEEDEREAGLRKILNFGHTFGHGIEAVSSADGMLHGECVALGMIPMTKDTVRERLIHVLKKLNLPYAYQSNIDSALDFATHDKKCRGGLIDVILVDRIGQYKIERMKIEDFKAHVRNNI